MNEKFDIFSQTKNNLTCKKTERKSVTLFDEWDECKQMLISTNQLTIRQYSKSGFDQSEIALSSAV